MQSLISLVFFLIDTKLETHSEYLIGTMIPASYIFLISFSTKGNKTGFILLSFGLKGFWFSLRGILCWMMLVSYDFKSLYPHANTSLNYLNSPMYCCLMWVGRVLVSLIILGSAGLPMLCSSMSVSIGSILGSLATSLKLKSCSNGVRSLGIVSFLHCKTSRSFWSELSIISTLKGCSKWFVSAEKGSTISGICSLFRQFSSWLEVDVGMEKSLFNYRKSSMCLSPSNTCQ